MHDHGDDIIQCIVINIMTNGRKSHAAPFFYFVDLFIWNTDGPDTREAVVMIRKAGTSGCKTKMNMYAHPTLFDPLS